jgi:spectinomycin phosphotransferase
VNTLPEEFDVDTMVGRLAEHWGIAVESAEYLPVGAGSYHWSIANTDGERSFVTVDDLDRKPWLGATRDEVFHGLGGAFDTAVALRNEGLRFVVAPIATATGDTLHRVAPRYSLALFPFVPLVDSEAGNGVANPFPHYETPDERADIVSMLAELHRATPTVGSVPRTLDLELPGRRELDAALAELGGTWDGGPYSEPARLVLGRHAADVVELLALADRLAAEVACGRPRWVVTHGEPHARNVLRTDEGRALVDWDTVALGPPERDLWMLMDGPGDVAHYEAATGHELDPSAGSFFRLLWDLADLASYLEVIRLPHVENEDTTRAYRRVTECVGSRDLWSELLEGR